MTRDRAEGRHADLHAGSAAANEDFVGATTLLETAGDERGWDPFEVWRTRVKTAGAKPARAGNERTHDAPR
jgi:hypothetical protein